MTILLYYVIIYTTKEKKTATKDKIKKGVKKMTNYKVYALITAISFSFAYFAVNYVIETMFIMLLTMTAATISLLFN